MRILLLNARYRGGGAERCARELTAALRARNIAAELAVGAKDPSYPPGVHGIRLPFEKYFRAIRWLNIEVDWRHIGSMRELSRIGPDNFDLVHGHNLFGGWISLNAVKQLARRIPLVWTFHDEWPVTLAGPYDLSRVMEPREINRRWEKFGGFYTSHPKAQRIVRFIQPRLPQPTAIICPSRWLANLTIESNRYPGVPIHHVPNGLEFLAVPETRMSRAEARKILGVPQDAKVILLLAAHLGSAFKGTFLAIEAFTKLKTSNVHLLMAGVTGHAQQEIAQSIHLPSTHLGYVSSDAKLAQMYRAADITLMPSTAENLPYVALESFACETPVVAFGVGGFPELIGDNARGMLAKPLDTDSLAAAMDQLLHDDSRRLSCGIHARQWAEQTCNFSKWIDAHLELYKQAIIDFKTHSSP